MAQRNGPVIDMTLEGNIVQPAQPTLGTILARLAVFGIGLFVLAIAFWAALFMVPVLLAAGVVGYFALRSQLRRNDAVVFRRRF